MHVFYGVCLAPDSTILQSTPFPASRPLLKLGHQWSCLGLMPAVDTWPKPRPSDFHSRSYHSDGVAVSKSLLEAGPREWRGSTCTEKRRKTAKRKETRSQGEEYKVNVIQNQGAKTEEMAVWVSNGFPPLTLTLTCVQLALEGDRTLQSFSLFCFRFNVNFLPIKSK